MGALSFADVSAQHLRVRSERTEVLLVVSSRIVIEVEAFGPLEAS